MTEDTKRKTLAYLLGVAVLTVLTAAALPQLQLKPGLPLPNEPTMGEAGVGPALSPLVISVSTFWKAVLSIVLLASLVYLVYRMLRGVAWHWRTIAKTLLGVAVVAFLVTGLLLILSRATLTFSPGEAEVLPPELDLEGPPLGSPPLGLIWLVWLCLAAMLAALGLWFFFRPAARRRADALSLEAERALEALRSGAALKHVIMRCYQQMGQVLKEEQGIELEATMTTREFERLLEARGVPSAPVHQLTQLFEAVRYGHQSSGAGDERQAVDCLTAIVRYCQAGKRPA